MIYLPKSRASLDRVVEAVADAWNLTPAELCQEGREQPAAFARQVGMYLSRRLTHASRGEISRAFNRSDHTTAIYASRKIERLLREPRTTTDSQNEDQRQALEKLIQRLEGQVRENTRKQAAAMD